MKSFIKDYKKISQIIDKNPNDPKAYFDRGLMVYTYICDFEYSPYQKEEEDEEEWDDLDEELAFADFNKVIELDPTNAIAYAMRANLHLANAEDDLYSKEEDETLQSSLALACQDIVKALLLDKDCKEAFVAQGAICSFMREYDQALAYYDQAIEIDHRYVKAIKERINTYEYLDEEYLDEVLEDYDKLIEIEPYKIGHYTDRGAVFSFIERYDMALLDFSKAIELDTDGSEDKLWNYVERAEVYNHLGRYDDALSDYNKAIAYEMEDVDDDNLKSLVYRSRAELFLTHGFLEEALLDFNTALIFTPYCELCYHGRAQVHEKQGNSQQAAEDYKRALQIEEEEENRFVNEIERRSKALEKAQQPEAKGLYIKVNNNKTN